MDFDEIGQINVDNFAKKIGSSKCFIVRDLSTDLLRELTGFEVLPDIKDANDVLMFDRNLIWEYLKRARALPQEHLLTFNSLRERVKDRF